MPTYEYKCEDCGVIEILHSIMDDAKEECPECGRGGLERLISLGTGFIFKGKQANQYNDIKKARFWRDQDGNRWPVTASDGSSNSPTVSKKRQRTDEQVKQIVKARKAAAKKKRNQNSYKRYVDQVKRTKRQ